jgi:myosin-5
MESVLKTELQQITQANSSAQQLLQNNMKRNPASQTEANMQHEITRLTGENFDLQEKIEALNEQVKRLKRQHKLYLKKLAESGG